MRVLRHRPPQPPRHRRAAPDQVRLDRSRARAAQPHRQKPQVTAGRVQLPGEPGSLQMVGQVRPQVCQFRRFGKPPPPGRRRVTGRKGAAGRIDQRAVRRYQALPGSTPAAISGERLAIEPVYRITGTAAEAAEPVRRRWIRR